MRLSEQIQEAIGDGLGPGGKCKCPKCGYSEPHKIGKPCVDSVCQKCGAKMIREDADADGFGDLDEAMVKVSLGETLKIAKENDPAFLKKMASSAAIGVARLMTSTSKQFKGQIEGWRGKLGFGLRNKGNQAQLQKSLEADFLKVIETKYK